MTVVEIPVTRAMDAADALALWRDTAVPVLEPTVPAFTEAPVVLTLDGELIVMQTFLTRPQVADLRNHLRQYPIVNTVTRGAGIRSRSQVFGNLAKNPLMQRSCCRPCAAATMKPASHNAICALAEHLAAGLAEHLPAQHAANVAAVSSVLPEWLLPGGLWTSGVVNSTTTLPYHRDRNNFDAWSAMPVIRRGIRGGHLHFPELAGPNGEPVVAPCADGSVLYFNGQRFMHGVTPITYAMKDGYRFSAVYYPVKKMGNCLDHATELAHAQTQRTALEDTLIARQTAAGYLRSEVDELGIHTTTEEVTDE